MNRSIASMLILGIVGTWAGTAVGAAGEPPLAVSPQALYTPPTWVQSGDEIPAPVSHEGGGGKLSDADPFTCGAVSLEFMTGYFPRAALGPKGPEINYLPQALRI